MSRLLLVVLAAACAACPESPIVDRVDKTAFIQIEADSFGALTPRQQALAYWLSQASIAVDPIIYDQLSRFGLQQKEMLEAVVKACLLYTSRGAANIPRDWLLDGSTDSATLERISSGVTPEQAAAVSKLMRLQDLVKVAGKIHVVTRFRTTVGLPGRMATRLQPNHPSDDARGIAASIIDGLMLGSGDAVIGINPASDNPQTVKQLLVLVDTIRQHYSIPTQSLSLIHISFQRANHVEICRELN